MKNALAAISRTTTLSMILLKLKVGTGSLALPASLKFSLMGSCTSVLPHSVVFTAIPSMDSCFSASKSTILANTSAHVSVGQPWHAFRVE